MICWKCQTEIPEGATFCVNCGAKLLPPAVLKSPLLERFLLKEEHRRGKLTTLYLAEEKSLGRKVALKLPRFDLAKEKILSLHLAKEATLITRLSHPYLAQIYSFESLEALSVLSMEWLEGETLKTRFLQKGPLSPSSLLEVMAPLCAVVSSLHNKGITHGDLSLEGIFLSPIPGEKRFLLKLLRFGISADLKVNQPLFPKTLAGEAPDRPIEEKERLENTDPSLDLYALGVLAYELLSGHSPFSGKPLGTFQYKTSPEVTSLLSLDKEGALPKALIEVVMRSLRPEKEERFPSALAFLGALEEALEAKPSEVTSLPDPKPLPIEEEDQPTPQEETAIEAVVEPVEAAEEPIEETVEAAVESNPKEEAEERAEERAEEAAEEPPKDVLSSLLEEADASFRASLWEEALPLYRQILDAHAKELSDETLIEFLYRLGKIRKETGDSAKAIEIFESVLEQDPQHQEALLALNSLLSGSNEWERAIEKKRSLLETKTDPDERFDILMEIGEIFREQLKKPLEAAEVYRASLEERPSSYDALHQLLTLYNDLKLWPQAIEIIDKLAILEEDPGQKAKLYYSIAALYKEELKNSDLSLAYLNKALDSDYTFSKAFERQVQLLTQERSFRALEQSYHRMLARIPEDQEELKASLWHNMMEAFQKNQDYDKAFCIAQALVFSRRASPEERGFYEQNRPKTLATAKRVIDEDTFNDLLRSPKEDAYISSIFRLISAPVSELYSQKEKELGLKPKERLDPTKTELMFPRRFQYVAKILKLPLPILYVQENRSGFDYELLLIDKVCKPAVVVGVDLLSGKTDKEVVFLITKNLMYLRPEYFLVRALKTNYKTLRLLLCAAMRIVAKDKVTPPEGEEELVEQLMVRLDQALPIHAIEPLNALVEEVISSGRRLSVSAWMQYVEIAANRTALLLSNDLEIAARVCLAETSPLSPLSAKEKLTDLLHFGVSDPYFQLRESLGLAIHS